jgi:hypothetical protein
MRVAAHHAHAFPTLQHTPNRNLQTCTRLMSGRDARLPHSKTVQWCLRAGTHPHAACMCRTNVRCSCSNVRTPLCTISCPRSRRASVAPLTPPWLPSLVTHSTHEVIPQSRHRAIDRIRERAVPHRPQAMTSQPQAQTLCRTNDGMES